MAESIRFVHAADLHLDAPFKGVDATDARVRDALVASTYDALDALVATCIECQADFLVIAGDVFNAAEKSLRAEFAFRDACEKLAESGIPVFIACGNHDPLNSRSAGLALPASVHVFSGTEVERFVFEGDGRPTCAIYGRSFRTAAERSNLASGFARLPGDSLAIGVLHANVGGRTDYEPYAPCSLDDLRAARMDYWALGHIHKPELLSSDGAVAYSGCTQGLNPNETGHRGCRVVTLDSSGVVSEFVPICGVTWEQLSIDVTSFDGVDDLVREAGARIDALAHEASRPVVARIELVGRADLHATLARPGAVRDLLADLRAGALERDPWIWIDRLADRTRPGIDLDVLRAGEDFAADLVRRADALLGDDGATLAFVQSVAAQALGTLDSRDVPDLDAATLVERARDLALDRLLSGEER